MAKPKFTYFLPIFLIIIVAIWVVLALTKSAPKANAILTDLHTPKTAAVNLDWPATGQAAVGTTQDGLLETNGAQTPVPTASVAKVITALAVLKQKPLSGNDQGPTITLGSDDVAIYNRYVAEDGSVVPVTAGMQISEHEALQAMMLPSANNIADSLAIWAFGSLSAYSNYANDFVKTLGMVQTTIGSDASGFLPGTTSTASDLFKLAQAAVNNPVLSDIVSERLADTPNFGTLYNVDTLIGSNGIVGIKTGNTDQAGGVFIFAAKHIVGGQNKTIIGAVAGDSDLSSALSDSQGLIESVDANFQEYLVVKAGQTVATYKTKWGTTASAAASKTIDLYVWKNKSVKVSKDIKSLGAPAAAGAQVGTIQVNTGGSTVSTPVILKNDIKKPPISWRLTHF